MGFAGLTGEGWANHAEESFEESFEADLVDETWRQRDIIISIVSDCTGLILYPLRGPPPGLAHRFMSAHIQEGFDHSDG